MGNEEKKSSYHGGIFGIFLIILSILNLFFTILIHPRKYCGKVANIQRKFNNNAWDKSKDEYALFKSLQTEYQTKNKYWLRHRSKFSEDEVFHYSVINMLKDIRKCNVYEDMGISQEKWLALYNAHAFVLGGEYKSEITVEQLEVEAKTTPKDEAAFLTNIRDSKHIAW